MRLKFLIGIVFLSGALIFSNSAFSSGTPLDGIIDVFLPTTKMSSKLSSSTIKSDIEEGVSKRKKLRKFVQGYFEHIKKDAATGSGEYIDAFYELAEYDEFLSKDEFNALLKANYSSLFENKLYDKEFFNILSRKMN